MGSIRHKNLYPGNIACSGNPFYPTILLCKVFTPTATTEFNGIHHYCLAPIMLTNEIQIQLTQFRNRFKLFEDRCRGSQKAMMCGYVNMETVLYDRIMPSIQTSFYMNINSKLIWQISNKPYKEIKIEFYCISASYLSPF